MEHGEQEKEQKKLSWMSPFVNTKNGALNKQSGKLSIIHTKQRMVLNEKKLE